MVVVAMTPRMMVSAFASPARPKSPSDQSVNVGPMALAGAHRSITMTMRVVASKERERENARHGRHDDAKPDKARHFRELIAVDLEADHES